MPITAPQTFDNPDPVDHLVVGDQAIADRNVPALMDVAKSNIGTDLGDAALNSAKQITKSAQEFQAIVQPIEDKGGPNTANGRLEVAKQYETVRDNPRYGSALVRFLTGDKMGAMRELTGGDVKKVITYDNNGHQYEVTQNDLGERSQFFDVNTGQFISKEEYAQRGGGLNALENSMAQKTREKLREAGAADMVTQSKSLNEWYQRLTTDAPLVNSALSVLQKYKTNIPGSDYAAIVKNISTSLGAGSSVSQSKQTLDQLNKAASDGSTFKADKELAARLGKPEGSLISVSGGQVFANGQKTDKSVSSLAQSMSSASINNENSTALKQTIQSLVASKKLSGLDATQQQEFLGALDALDKVGASQAELSSRVPMPSFLSMPLATGIQDNQAKLNIQALQTQHNLQQIQYVAEFWKNAKTGYERTGTTPLPGEILMNAAKTPQFQATQDEFAKRILEETKKNYTATPEVRTPEVRTPPKKPTAAKPPAFDLKALEAEFKASRRK